MEIKSIIFWVLLLAFVVPGFVFGFQKLLAQRQKSECFIRWGYPLWFMRLLGLAEVAACCLMLYGPTRVYGMAVFPVILTGAVYTHLRHHDPAGEALTPVFVGIHLLVLFLFTLWIQIG